MAPASSSPIREPLDLRVLFDRPWAGPVDLWRPRWLRWMGIPDRLHFRTEIVEQRGERWTARDTLTYPDGRTEIRTLEAEQVSAEEVHAKADDIRGLLRLRLRPDGFDFDPYTLLVPVAGVRVPLRCRDRVKLLDGELHDRIEMRFLGVRVGRVEMRLRPL